MTVTERDLFRGYTAAARTVEAVALLNVIEQRIRDLWGYRAWWRTHRWADWPAQRAEFNAELRVLVGLLREARGIAGAPTDPIDAYRAGMERGHGYHDVQAR
jgi:hypothetical protein